MIDGSRHKSDGDGEHAACIGSVGYAAICDRGAGIFVPHLAEALGLFDGWRVRELRALRPHQRHTS